MSNTSGDVVLVNRYATVLFNRVPANSTHFKMIYDPFACEQQQAMRYLNHSFRAGYLLPKSSTKDQK